MWTRCAILRHSASCVTSARHQFADGIGAFDSARFHALERSENGSKHVWHPKNWHLYFVPGGTPAERQGGSCRLARIQQDTRVTRFAEAFSFSSCTITTGGPHRLRREAYVEPA